MKKEKGDRGDKAQAAAPAVPELLTPKQGAKLLGMTTTLRRWVATGLMPEPLHFGKMTRRFKADEVRAVSERMASERDGGKGV
jgi:hypothetical protein